MRGHAMCVQLLLEAGAPIPTSSSPNFDEVCSQLIENAFQIRNVMQTLVQVQRLGQPMNASGPSGGSEMDTVRRDLAALCEHRRLELEAQPESAEEHGATEGELSEMERGQEARGSEKSDADPPQGEDEPDACVKGPAMKRTKRTVGGFGRMINILKRKRRRKKK